MKKRKTLAQIRQRVAELVPQLQVHVSNNFAPQIIAMLLSQAAADYGPRAANKIIRDEGLEDYGWRQEVPVKSARTKHSSK